MSSNRQIEVRPENSTGRRHLSPSMSLRAIATFILALAACPEPGGAAEGLPLWGASGIKLAEETSPHLVRSGGIASDANGGAIAVWTEYLDLTPATHSAIIRAQRIDAGGNKLWASGGAGNYVSFQATCHEPRIAPDGTGGGLIVWYIGQATVDGIYVQRMDSNGARLWGDLGVKVGTSLDGGSGAFVAQDKIGGAFIGWGHRLTHVQPTGAVDSPGLDGIQLVPGSGAASFKMISDGTGGSFPTPVPGGIFAAWSTANGDIVAQRVKAGLPWGSSGLVVASHLEILGYDLVRDGSGGMILCWVAKDGSYPYRHTVRAQRLDSNGTKLWPAAGVIVLDSDVISGSYAAPYYSEPAITTDGANGAIIAWLDSRNWGAPSPPPSQSNLKDLYAQRIDANGNLLWNPAGVLLPPYVYGQVAPGAQGAPHIVSDTHTGAIVAYDDAGMWGWDIAGTRLAANGMILWKNWIRYDGTSTNDPGLPQTGVQISYDASGSAPKGALLIWNESDGGHHRVYAQKVEADPAAADIPANDTCTGAIALTDNTYYSQSTVTATDDGYSACLGRARTKGLWLTYTANQNGTVTVDTCPSSFDTLLEIFTGNCGALTSIACNDDSAVCGAYKSAANFNGTAGTTYYIWAGGYNGQSGNLQVRARAALTSIILTNIHYDVSYGARFTILGAPGDEYIVFGSENFLDWFQLGIVSNVTGSVDFTNAPPPGYTRRFYRCQKW